MTKKVLVLVLTATAVLFANCRQGTKPDAYARLEAENKELKSELKKKDTELSNKLTERQNQYDMFSASLKGELDTKTVELQRYKDALTINIMDQVFFKSGESEIKPEAYDLLSRVAQALNKLPDTKVIRIEGHTDDIPIGKKLKTKYPDNWTLGAARSITIANYLTEKGGVNPNRVAVVSYASYRPIVPNNTEKNRAKNRRIEIVIMDRLAYQAEEIASGSNGQK